MRAGRAASARGITGRWAKRRRPWRHPARPRARPSLRPQPQARCRDRGRWPGATTLNFPDGTALPGLIDCHAHLMFDAGSDPVSTVLQSGDEDLLAGMVDRARQLVGRGVTTVRDLGDRNGLAVRLRDMIGEGVVPGPRILSATTPLTSPGGHCWFLGGGVEGEAAIRERVRENIRAGADVIKVMGTGGGLTKGGPEIWQTQFSERELRIVVEEAARAGLPVAVHAHGTEGIEVAVAAGVDTIEHCTWMAKDGGFDMREELVAEIKAKGIHVCTATSPNWRGFADRVGPERAEQLFSSMRWMAAQKVPMIAGTDAGVTRAVFDQFTNTLEFYEYLGISNAGIIDMATTDAARALRLGSKTGRLAAGYSADVLVVDGDPLSDLGALRDVRHVLAAGRSYTP
ncbi:metal-dependent hydrolase family protein [Streptomyces prunicolor]|uniref:Amidohydrolase family protein n=1 Tax=Streptomyces prunicolor TaxID=67348 RepID=A0ABU4FM81_9ACTN|nr:amidohydrolase family protein [Streptomyces prunicolor]MDV7221698.1 amidohydrolase family protein [Streptomyces prunicolor]